MGWTFTHKPSGMTIKDFFQREFSGCTIHECKVIKYKTAYMAVSNNKNPDVVFGVVCLLNYRPKDYFNFGYKDVDESMGPYQFDCPESILNKLTSTNNVYATKWRTVCKEIIEKRKTMPKLIIGHVLKLNSELTFNDGTKRTDFTIQSLKPLRLIGSNGIRYRIPRSVLNSRGYTVI